MTNPKLKISLIISFCVLMVLVLWTLLVPRPSLPTSTPSSSQGEILGGIVPHHLLVADIIENFFLALPKEGIDQVVVLGPNHQEQGSENIITGINNPIIRQDQSISALIPYLTRYFPSSTITPYLLKQIVSLEELQALVQTIRSYPGKTLVLASVDFSHYLTQSEAEYNDGLTLSLIQDRRYKEILDLDSAYLDSPGSLVTALLYFDLMGATDSELLAYENSGNRGQPGLPTTSYYALLYKTPPSSHFLASSPPSPSPSPISLILTGDVMLARSVATRIAYHQDPTWPFLNVATLLKEADLTYINLENPLVSDCPLTDTGMIFCSASQNVEGLVFAGVDVASLANNHSTNYGQSGLDETVETLNQAGIKVVGLSEPAIFYPAGQKIAFVSFNDVGVYPGLSQATPANIAFELQSPALSEAFIVATFHWGAEYTASPSSRQRELAKVAVEAGADLVVGAHPHWVQSSESYQGVPIYYSLGNFIFDQEWSRETKTGMALQVTLQNGSITQLMELPVWITDYGQANWQLSP